MERSDSRRTRRDVLQGAVAASLAAAGPGCGLTSPRSATPANADAGLIRRENRRGGSLDWQLGRVAIPGQGSAAVRSTFIEGYCSHQSIEAGQTLRIMVSAKPACPYKLEVFRMGYYGGRGARLMGEYGPFEGKPQPDPPIGPNRIRECRWEPSIELKVAEDWPSGVYLGRLTRLPADKITNPWQNFVIFIVKDNRPADVLFQCSDNTWQAYNRWPNTFSLYDDGKFDDGTDGWFIGPGVDVSFDRPYGKYRQFDASPLSSGTGEFLLWEYPLCYWLESQGYDVTYCSNSDMLTPERGLRCKTFVSIGHDEYWDERQYHSVKAMIDAGVSAQFLCGNSVCFVSPYKPSSEGVPNRVIHRHGTFGPLSKKEEAILSNLKYEGPDEAMLIGAKTVIPFNGGGDWVVTKPEHWIFQGTGMKQGEGIAGLVGWEFHGEPGAIPGLEVVAAGTALAGGVFPAPWAATIYPGPRGNWVFNASTIWWAQGLAAPPGHQLPWSHGARPHGPDVRVQQITRNVLDRAIQGRA